MKRLVLCVLLPLALSAGEWPLRPHAEDGMLWFWRNLNHPGMIETRDGDWVADAETRLRNRARPNWFLGADIENGGVEALDTGDAARAALAGEAGLFVEMAVHPRETPPAGVLFSLGRYRLIAEEGRLALARGNRPPRPLGPLALDKPAYLSFHLTPGDIRWAVDGVPAGRHELDAPLSLDGETAPRVVFGGGGGFPGVVEYLVLAKKPRPVKRAAALWKEENASREEPPKILSRTAKLVKAATEPDPVELEEYSECLLASVWEWTDAEGESKRAVVWHWYQLDGRILDEARPPEPGAKRRFRLSPYESQPQTKGLQKVQTDLDPMDLILLPAYLVLEESPVEAPR